MTEQIERDPRVYMAAERTLLAWIRTGLALMGFGFVVARFGLFLREIEAAHGGHQQLSPHGSLWFGTALVFAGVIVNLVAAAQHTRYVHRLRTGTWTPEQSSRTGVVLAGTLAMGGIAIAMYLIIIR